MRSGRQPETNKSVLCQSTRAIDGEAIVNQADNSSINLTYIAANHANLSHYTRSLL